MKGQITRVWVATVRVRDLATSVKFYRDLLGLKVQLAAPQFGWIELGPDEPAAKLALAQVQSEDAQRIGGPTGIVLDTDDIHEFHRRLAAAGIRFTQAPDRQPWGGLQADFLDPDGNELQIVEDPEHYARHYPNPPNR